MDEQELHRLIRNLREIRTDTAMVEAKRAERVLPKSLWATISAFSNTRGGTVILGLTEDQGFAATGVIDAGKILADLAAVCSEEFEPPVRPASLDIIQFEGVHLIVAEFNEIGEDDKPCFVRNQGKEKGSYRRTADGDRHMTTHEIAGYTNRGQPRDDERAVPGATLRDLDREAVARLLERLRHNSPRAYPTSLPEADILTRLGILVELDGERVPTRGGLLALGLRPQDFFPQLNLTFVHYPTVDGRQLATGERFSDNRKIEGSIPIMVRDTLDVLRRNMARRAHISGAGRTDIFEYPELALREAVVNALIHRDLKDSALGSQVQVEMYPDRILINNPGGLFGTATIDQLATGLTPSSSRNARLVSLLEDVVIPGENHTICENRGSGIRTMQQAMMDAGMSPAKLEDKFTSFLVTFPNNVLLDDETVQWIRSLGQAGLTDSQHTALALMRRGEELTNSSYRTRCHLDSRVAGAELKDLVARKLAVAAGATSSTTYSLSERISNPAGRVSPADRRDQILRVIGRERVSRSDIEVATGLKPQATRSWLKTLQDEGRIKLDGPPTSNKARYYALPPFVDEIPVSNEQMSLDLTGEHGPQ